jgi:hypothetical protein
MAAVTEFWLATGHPPDFVRIRPDWRSHMIERAKRLRQIAEVLEDAGVPS